MSLLTVHEAAEHMQVDPETIRRWIRSGRIPYIRAGSHYRLRRTDLERGVTIPPPRPARHDREFTKAAREA